VNDNILGGNTLGARQVNAAQEGDLTRLQAEVFAYEVEQMQKRSRNRT